MVYSTRRFVLCLTLCYFVLVFFSPFSIGISSLGEERANLSAFHAFVRFVLVWFCRFPIPLGVWEGLRFVIVAFTGLFSYPFLCTARHGLFILPRGIIVGERVGGFLWLFLDIFHVGMVGEACLPSNAYYPRTPDYTLYSEVHVCWFEHSDSSFVYGFMRLSYGLGTMTQLLYHL